MTVRIGTAGWSLPQAHRTQFPGDGALLERYARRLGAAEINTTFYRPHKPETFVRWAASTPPGFAFSVKVPKTMTHEARLAATEPLLDAFLAQVGGLGGKLGVLLVQLPPSLALDPDVATAFFQALGQRSQTPVALEPRHASWFTGEADDLLRAHRIARVAADPAKVPAAAEPGGWPGLVYLRLHGSPRMYASAYETPAIEAAAARLAAATGEAWCIFDNTLLGAALGDALKLRGALGLD